MLQNSAQQKIFHAFQIFGMFFYKGRGRSWHYFHTDDDGDGIISPDDLSAMLDKITDKGIGQDQKEIIIATVCNLNREYAQLKLHATPRDHKCKPLLGVWRGEQRM